MTKSLLKVTQWLLTIMVTTSALSQQLSPSWTFKTGDKVLASPVTNGNSVYVGSQNGIMYALDEAGNVIWEYDAKGIIQAQALLTDRVLFFESANVFYALDPAQGKLLWKYDAGMEPQEFVYKGHHFPYKIDFWDDKRSVGTLNDGVIYIGASNGHLYGFDEDNGEVILDISSDGLSPIRSTPLVANSILYFGDWEGVAYAFDLNAKAFAWKKKTYRGDRPYPSFGGISASFIPYNDLLIFGARNHQMNVLYAETGEKEWTYTDPKGGWMVGDPVLLNDTLYIGGSDNFSMYAFDPKWGRFLWQHNGGKNIYTRPIVTSDYVIYTAGNGYNWMDKGVVYVLNRSTGEELAKFETPNAIFSSPILLKDKVVFGCHDGQVYALAMNGF